MEVELPKFIVIKSTSTPQTDWIQLDLNQDVVRPSTIRTESRRPNQT